MFTKKEKTVGTKERNKGQGERVCSLPVSWKLIDFYALKDESPRSCNYVTSSSSSLSLLFFIVNEYTEAGNSLQFRFYYF